MVERHLRYRTVERFPTELAQRGPILPENGPIGSQSPVDELDGPGAQQMLKDDKRAAMAWQRQVTCENLKAAATKKENEPE